MGVRDVFIFPRQVLRYFGACGIFLALILPPPIAHAATFTVTNLNDSGVGSLRQAILDANAAIGASTNTIQFQSGLSGNLLTAGNLSINGKLELIGPGANVLTLFGNKATIFVVNRGATVTLSGLKITNGNDGIANFGTLTVNNSILADNAASGISNWVVLTVNDSILADNAASGINNAVTGTVTVNRSTVSGNELSGISDCFNTGGTVTVSHSTLSGNSSTNGGGGICSTGTLTVRNSTLSGNSSAAGAGGGIHSRGLLVTIAGNTLSGNTARNECGGGMYVNGATTFVFHNNTLSGNTARWGGGLCVAGNFVFKTVNNTLSGNTASGFGGGIQIRPGSILSIGNSLVASNTAPTAREINSDGTFVSDGHNLFGENGSSGLVDAIPATSDKVLAGLIGTAIGPLANNGGPTLTHLPVAGSPLLDAGNNALIPVGVTTDQRGQPRIQFGKVDIGAVEVDTVSPAQTLIDNYYRTILSRAPDAGGLAFWQDEVNRLRGLGVDVQEVFRVMAGWFFNSAEYLAKNASDSQYVTDLYRTFFQRDPDAGGLGYWTGQLAQGMPRSVVLFSFLFSTEFGAYMQGLLGDTASRAEVYAVVDFYRGFLNRLADDGGFNYWIGRFRAAQCQGAAAVNAEVDSISTQYLGSGEYTGRNRSNRDYVADLYYAFLRRGGELTGFNFWVNQLNGGLKTREQLRQEFLKSAEFQGRVSQIIGQGCL